MSDDDEQDACVRFWFSFSNVRPAVRYVVVIVYEQQIYTFTSFVDELCRYLLYSFVFGFGPIQMSEALP